LPLPPRYSQAGRERPQTRRSRPSLRYTTILR